MAAETDPLEREAAAAAEPERPGRVAVVTDSLPARNGVGAYYLDLLEHLEQRGFETLLLCPQPDKWAPRMPLPGDSTQRIYLPSPARFSRELRELQPDCIIVATPGPYGQVGAWFANHLGVRLIAGFHTNYAGVTDLYSNAILRPLSRFYFGIADRMLFRRADLALGNSAPMLTEATRLGARAVGTMGTLLPMTSLAPPVSKPPGALQHVLFAGRLATEKNVQHVVDAARELPHLNFTIAGDGPLKKSIAAQADELPNLDFLGWVARDDLLAAMDCADMLVLPSQLESFGTVALEAMARERLALVSLHCGIVEWADLAPQLYCIEAGQTLTVAIRAVAALSDDERHAQAQAARAAAVAHCEASLDEWLGRLQRE